jgi:hypothetical protein
VKRGLKQPGEQKRRTESPEERQTWHRFLPAPKPRHLAAGLALATLFLILAVGLASIPYAPYRASEAFIQVSIGSSTERAAGRLVLEVDGQRVWQSDGGSTFVQAPVSPGPHQVRPCRAGGESV